MNPEPTKDSPDTRLAEREHGGLVLQPLDQGLVEEVDKAKADAEAARAVMASIEPTSEADALPDPLEFAKNASTEQVTTEAQSDKGVSVSPVPLPPTVPLAPPSHRSHRGMFVGMLVLVLILAGLGGGAWWYYDNFPLKYDYSVAIDHHNRIFNLDTERVKVLTEKDLDTFSEEEIETGVKKLKDIRSKLDDELAQFQTLRANKNESVRDVFGDLKKKYEALLDEEVALREGYSRVKKMDSVCGSVDIDAMNNTIQRARTGDEAVATYTQYMQPCMDEAARLKSSKSDTIRVFADERINASTQVGNALKKMGNATTLRELAEANKEMDVAEQLDDVAIEGLKLRMDQFRAKAEKLRDSEAQDLKNALERGQAEALI